MKCNISLKSMINMRKFPPLKLWINGYATAFPYDFLVKKAVEGEFDDMGDGLIK